MQGLVLENRSPQIDGVLGALLAKLEKDKPAINAGLDDQQYCENFAVRVFSRAEKVDRAGRAYKGTATTYYAASVFIEVCHSRHALLTSILPLQEYHVAEKTIRSHALKRYLTAQALCAKGLSKCRVCDISPCRRCQGEEG